MKGNRGIHKVCSIVSKNKREEIKSRITEIILNVNELSFPIQRYVTLD